MPLAPAINPAGYALAQTPLPRALSDPGQALAQKIVGKNQLTDPTYKVGGTKDTSVAAAPLPAKPTAPATALSTEFDDPFKKQRLTALDDGTSDPLRPRIT